MKKVIIAVFFLLFFCGPNVVWASEEPVDYQLPYPGILPDNPLYFLKTTRDSIVSFLISDPLKKAEFNLLSSDKYLNSGFYLHKKKGKDELVLSEIKKAENYFAQAIIKVREAKKQGVEVNSVLRKFSQASKKHQEVLKQLEKESSAEKKDFASLTKKAEGFEQEVEQLIQN